MNTLVLAGGGIDSTLCAHLLKEEGHSIRLLHIDFGQKASAQEWKAVQKISSFYASPSSQILLKNIENTNDSNIIGRNAAFIFLALLAKLKEENCICIGIHKGTPFYDCSNVFFLQAKNIINEYTNACVSLIAPLVSFDKREVILLAKEKSIPIEHTYSCQNGSEKICGICHSCKDRGALGC